MAEYSKEEWLNELRKRFIVISEDGTKTEVFAIAPYLAEAER